MARPAKPRNNVRLRIGLVFAVLLVLALATLILGLWLGYSRSGGDPNGFVTAGLVSGFGLFGLTAGIWYLFDKNVGQPIDRIAADLRSRAHADIGTALNHDDAGFLGDLGPAAQALNDKLGATALATADHVASETARLSAELQHLTSVLTEIPMAVMMVSDDHTILLYDGQASHALDPVRPLCLGHSVFDYVSRAQIEPALAGLTPRAAATLRLATADGTRVFDAILRRMEEGAGYMLTLQTEPDARGQRPLVSGLGAIPRTLPASIRDANLGDLTFVIFDTETTGLLPERDEVVQIGAVRAVGPRLIPGEVFDTLVNPGRPIPVTSTRVHGITDDMVIDAPKIDLAVSRFLQFSEGAVLVAHNAPFDMAFLRRYSAAMGREMPHPVLDTVLLATELFGAQDGLTLDDIAARLGEEIPTEHRHTALGDAEATAAVFLKLIKVLQGRGHKTLGELIDIQKSHDRVLRDVNAG